MEIIKPLFFFFFSLIQTHTLKAKASNQLKN